LAQALEVEPATLLHVNESDPRYIHTENGKGVPVEREYPESGFLYRALAKGKNSKCMEPFLLEIPPRATRKFVSTNGDEFCYLLEGRLLFHLGDQIVPMERGDSLYFEGEIPHFPENPAEERALLLVLYSITH
jgi:mannose-6-phosphate isomerase-like protein (cupin superfamily)